MAQRIILVDDIDGTDAEETVTFGIDGKAYEIDLNSEHAKDLRNRFTGYAEKAREVKKFPIKEAGSTGSATKARAGQLPQDGATYQEKQARKKYLSKVRKWGMDQGLPVNATGRVPQEIQDAYDAAH
jgi:hypothetical protein